MPSQALARLLKSSPPLTCQLRKALCVLSLLAVPMGAAAVDRDKAKDNRRGTCATTYTVVQQDESGNTEQQGILKAKNRKWADRDLWKRYPDVCYVSSGSAAKAVFIITALDYRRLTLTVETLDAHGNPVIQRSFTQPSAGYAGLYGVMYRTMDGAPAHTHHPARDLIEDAVKWIHLGGLDNTY
jgi:hypothetical protein